MGKLSVNNNESKTLHMAMYPWFAVGHLTPFLHLANKLAQRGHRISFFHPNKSLPKLPSHNHQYPSNLVTFIPITVPAADVGLPPGTETTADIPLSDGPLLMGAMDLTQPIIESLLTQLKPDFIFFDFAHWIPGLARKHRVKPVFYPTSPLSFFAYLNPRARNLTGTPLTEAELMRAPPGFPSSSFRLQAHEARGLAMVSGMEFGLEGVTLLEKVWLGIQECDAICCKGCQEMEGQFGDYFLKHHGKQVLWAGPALPERPISMLDEELDAWLKRFEEGSVVYCALGSEFVLDKSLFQELVLGLELTGLPFLAALKLPTEDGEDIDLALPQGFKERTKERGIIHPSWVQQQMILKHPSVGCFVTHCGAGSLSEGLVSECQLVLLPQNGDQFTNSRLMSGELRVGVEIKRREEDGFFTKEAVNEAIVKVMDPKNEMGREIRANHDKWREFLSREGLEESYISSLVQNLQDLATTT